MFQRPAFSFGCSCRALSFSTKTAFLLFYCGFVVLFCFLYIYNVATFILLSDDSDSNCFLFPLKMHTRNWSKQTNKTGIGSRVLHVVAFVVAVGFRPPFKAPNQFDDFCSGSSLSLTPVLQLPLLFCGKTTGICFPV